MPTFCTTTQVKSIYYETERICRSNIIKGKYFSMSLTSTQKKQFRTIGHKLNPIITVAGNGLSENILLEADRALEDHELIKVKFAVGDRDAKKQLITEMAKIVEALIVQEIGNVALFYRAAKSPDPKLSNLLR
jgi:RNA-binding protein